MSRQILKQWLEFSNSETKPLFWMLIGPLLVILTLVLTIPTLSNPFLFLVFFETNVQSLELPGL